MKLNSEMAKEFLEACAEAIHEWESLQYQLDTIRATLLVNFGKGMKSNHYGFHIEDENQPTLAMLLFVLRNLAANRELAEVLLKNDSLGG